MTQKGKAGVDKEVALSVFAETGGQRTDYR